MERAVVKRSSNIPTPVLGMAIFLMTEVMLFSGLITAYWVLRAKTGGSWPLDGLPRLPVSLSAANMMVLVCSGISVWCAGRNRSARRRWMLAAILAGSLFLIVQGFEWSRILTVGLSGDVSIFAGVFYAIVGVHTLHVFGGVAALMWAYRKVSRSDDERSIPLTISAMYWYLVVAVWPVLYLLLYVI